jgi:fimbrial chaperone protein
VREVPEVSAPKDKSLQLPIALVLSMPVFVTPVSAKRQVACELAPPTGPKSINVSCSNTGTAYAQLRELEVRRNDQIVARFEGSAYILPGARRVLSLTPEGSGVAAGAAELRVLSDDPAPLTFPVSLP